MRGHSWCTEGSLCGYMLPRSWLPEEKINKSTLAWQVFTRKGGMPRSQYWKIMYTNHTTYLDGFYSNTGLTGAPGTARPICALQNRPVYPLWLQVQNLLSHHLLGRLDICLVSNTQY